MKPSVYSDQLPIYLLAFVTKRRTGELETAYLLRRAVRSYLLTYIEFVEGRRSERELFRSFRDMETNYDIYLRDVQANGGGSLQLVLTSLLLPYW